MPTSKHRKNRSPKPAHLPAKATASAPETLLPAPIRPPDAPLAVRGLAEMRGNEREIDLSALSPRQQAALPIVACFPTIVQAARAANVGESTFRRWLTDPAFSACLAEIRRQSASVARQKLLELTPLCMSVLADAMLDPDPAIRLRAANYTLSFNARAAEFEALRSKLQNYRSEIANFETAADLRQQST